ncbi:non-ribosomal peptide synthetase [Micromonospora sp. MW-13]|uniref:non-ribosomal peptide synthetase n=1 Tax=Micromonospora sp. MW-13 TaxID=2094022 RepID=UPI000E44CC0F|nr:non-ribosomal peptide synthetase [Micromonospora sp. MW-13]
MAEGHRDGGTAPTGGFDVQRHRRADMTGGNTVGEGPAAASVGEWTGGIPARIKACATRTPDAPAVLFDGVSWTYQRLGETADRITRQLQRHGAGPGTFVAVQLDRSPWLVATILAVWQSGAAVVPLDSDQPLDRLRRMLSTDPPRLGVTDHRQAELPEVTTWLDLAAMLSAQDDPAIGSPPSVQPDDIAYVYFTSGSSGTPKGIAGMHGGVLNYFDNLCLERYIDADDLVVQLAAVSFDASLRDMFFPLTVGARTVITPKGGRDAAAALRVIVDAGVTAVLAVVPSLVRELVREADRLDTTVPAVRVILVSGEKLHHADVAALRRVFVNAKIVNMYGPSECTMTATAYEIPGETIGTDVPIGQPITGVSVQLLDRLLNLVPVGQSGEVYIGGAGLTQGYWHRPGITAERFVPNPFGRPGERMYRTGDTARVGADGFLEFLGRTDNQVKIRGQRVELGEVEAALSALPAVREAACRVWDATLVAYVAWSDTTPQPTIGDLRASLASALPDHSIPTTFVSMDALPHNRTGKLDRQALPEPPAERSALLDAPTAASDPLEDALIAVWTEVLDATVVGVHDSFFDLGGHSLLAMRLAARISDVLGTEIPLRAVFDAPTVAAMAEFVGRTTGDHTRTPVCPSPDGSPRLSPSQSHIWHVDRHLAPGNACYNVAGIFRICGDLDIAALTDAITEIVRRHEALRTVFPDLDGEPTVRLHPPAPTALSVDDLGTEPQSMLTERIHAVVQRGFDLANGPLWRTGLIRLSRQEHVFFLVAHHIVFDGHSMGNYYRELTELYRAFSSGLPSPLTPVPLQYPDFATWQRAQLEAGTWDSDITYWRNQLAEAVPLIRLPDGYPFTEDRYQRRRHRAKPLGEQRTRNLLRLAARSQATPSMLLMAVFQAALFLAFGQEAFHVATPVANRARPERKDMIGFVANTLLIRADVTADLTLSELLARVRASLLDGFAHAEPPLESLRGSLAEFTSDVHLAQALFNMQEAPDDGGGIPGLTITPVDPPDAWSRYPIALFVTQRPSDIDLHFVYDSVLFDPEWADSTVRTVDRLIDSVLDGDGDDNRADLPISVFSKDS